jgi:hypothetical protein
MCARSCGASASDMPTCFVFEASARRRHHLLLLLLLPTFIPTLAAVNQSETWKMDGRQQGGLSLFLTSFFDSFRYLFYTDALL